MGQTESDLSDFWLNFSFSISLFSCWGWSTCFGFTLRQLHVFPSSRNQTSPKRRKRSCDNISSGQTTGIQGGNEVWCVCQRKSSSDTAEGFNVSAKVIKYRKWQSGSINFIFLNIKTQTQSETPARLNQRRWTFILWRVLLSEKTDHLARWQKSVFIKVTQFIDEWKLLELWRLWFIYYFTSKAYETGTSMTSL